MPSPTFWLRPRCAFEELAARWRQETQLTSSIQEMVEHKAYKEIIQMGWLAVPFLLEEMAKPDPDHWGPALTKITGEQPVPDEAVGRVGQIAHAWLEWAREKGYLRG